MMIDLPHVGWTNPEQVSRVWATASEWRSRGPRWKRVYDDRGDHEGHLRRATGKPWKHKGKWHRPNSWWDDLRWYVKATVMVRLVGKEYPTEIECRSDAEALRWRDEILAAINAARELGSERIVAAAIQRLEIDRSKSPGPTDSTPYVWMTYTMPAPARHHHILHSMPPLNPVVPPEAQGFLTSTGRFVTRKEAMGIAVSAGQVPASKVTAPDLFSEDLW